MRKVFLGALAIVFALSAGVSTAFAAGLESGRCFVDVDGDGVCDNAGSMCIYADADGDSVCDVCGTSHGNCLTGDEGGFVDADGDGVCDNCGIYHWCNMAGSGANYVDADGDGVCDNYTLGQGRGNGRGNGFKEIGRAHV